MNHAPPHQRNQKCEHAVGWAGGGNKSERYCPSSTSSTRGGDIGNA